MKPEIVIMGYVFHNNKVLLVKHKKKNEYMSCGGHLEIGESFIDCLKREIKEETNLDIDVIDSDGKKFHFADISPFFIMTKNIGDKKLIILEYLCTTNNIDNFKLKDDELLEHVFLSKEEINNFKMREIVKEIAHKGFEHIEKLNSQSFN